MSILVAGGAGFIGTNLCKTILENDKYKEIICIDNLYTGKTKNILPLIHNYPDRFCFIEEDICNVHFMDIQDDITEVYNLACPASPVAYQGAHALETIKTCVQGTLNLAELSREHNAKMLQASTSEIYGEPEEHPQKEGYRGAVSTTGIRACYDEGKRCTETIMAEYNRIYDMDTKIVRIFNTYGPYMDKNDGRVITNVISQALTNSDITVYGYGTQTRSFCYVDDLVRGLLSLMATDDIHSPVNLGNPKEFTINELVELVQKKIPESTSKVTYHPLPQDDPSRRRPCIDKASNLLHWQPEIELAEGLDRTIEYLRGEV